MPNFPSISYWHCKSFFFTVANSRSTNLSLLTHPSDIPKNYLDSHLSRPVSYKIRISKLYIGLEGGHLLKELVNQNPPIE